MAQFTYQGCSFETEPKEYDIIEGHDDGYLVAYVEGGSTHMPCPFVDAAGRITNQRKIRRFIRDNWGDLR